VSRRIGSSTGVARRAPGGPEPRQRPASGMPAPV